MRTPRWVLLCAVAALSACSGGSGADDPENVVLPSLTLAKPGGIFTYLANRTSIAAGERTVRVQPDADFHGTKARVFAVENGAAPTDPAFRIGVTEPGPSQVGLVGAEIWKGGTTPWMTLVGDKPLVIDWGKPAGTTADVPAKGQLFIGGAPQVIDTAIQVKILEKGVTRDSPRGPITGCIHATGDGNIAGTFHFEVWFKPGVGVVDATATHPLLREARAGLLRTFHLGEDMGEGYRRATSGSVIGGAYPGRYTLDTASTAGKNDADKNTHAKMWLELRWADETRAKTPERPSVSTEFGTIFGTFPHQLVQSPVSLFHPEENGKGFVYWLARVDQAAKNELANPIAYHITVTAGLASPKSEVRADGQIRYKVLAP